MDDVSYQITNLSAAGSASTHLPFVHDNHWQPSYQGAYGSQNRIATVSALGGLEAILDANRPALGRFLRARLRGDDGADDVLQDLWIKVRTIDAGPIAEPLAYLYRMAENLVLDRRRAGGRRNAREQEWTASQIDGTLKTPADAAPNAERILIARDMLRRVDARLDALPERTAFVFRSVRVEGRPQKELAAELAISLSAIEKHLQRAYREIVAVHDELNADCDGSRRLPSDGATNDT
jgi:RNA polymerase sigma factor (sigma-70 family)